MCVWTPIYPTLPGDRAGARLRSGYNLSLPAPAAGGSVKVADGGGVGARRDRRRPNFPRRPPPRLRLRPTSAEPATVSEAFLAFFQEAPKPCVLPGRLSAGATVCRSSSDRRPLEANSLTATAFTGRPLRNRGWQTNDPRRLSLELDGRSAEGRRFADIYDLVALDHHPGANPLRVREIALLKYELERAQGVGKCSLEDVVRMHNLIGRREKELRAEGKRKAEAAPAAPSVSDILKRYPARAS